MMMMMSTAGEDEDKKLKLEGVPPPPWFKEICLNSNKTNYDASYQWHIKKFLSSSQ